MSDENTGKALFHRLVDEVWNEGKVEVIDELFPPGSDGHVRRHPL